MDKTGEENSHHVDSSLQLTTSGDYSRPDED